MSTAATFTLLLPSISAATKRRRSSKREYYPRHRKQIYNPPKPKPIYPITTPTPLLDHKPHPQSHIQALTSVVNELESSVKRGIVIDLEIYASLLETCHRLNSIQNGIRVHRLIPESVVRRNVGISSKLVRMYAASGMVEDAHQVFDEMCDRKESAFAWNALISGYAEMGMYEDALAVYFQMEEEGVEPDGFTFPRALKACGGVGVLGVGERVHRDAVRCGFGLDGYVMNGLVDMYAKCGHIVKARKVFDRMAVRDLVSWNSMLTGYVRHGLLSEAVRTFRVMIRDGFGPDSVALSAILTGGLPLEVGAQIHGWVTRCGLESHLSIGNALIVFYSNQSHLNQARWIFDNIMPEKDVVSWNSIISAHFKDAKAITYFHAMERTNCRPDFITFVSLLSTCAHLGLVEQGSAFFSKMKERYSVHPTMEHYACMVNLYGRAGLIKEAYKIITEKMEFPAGETVWGALLYACYVHGNVDVGEIAASHLFDLEEDNEHNFQLLMRIYENAGRLNDAERVRVMMMDRGL
ncbi:hypothetical protein QQ045_022074 [Rhodiola kirilowii]